VADGRTPVASLDLYSLDRLGRAGAAAREQLTELAARPGFETLGQALANPLPEVPQPEGEDPAALRAELVGVLPLQPPTATATRDMLLAAADPYMLRGWIDSCTPMLSQGGRACVMVVTDLLPAEPGEEAVMIGVFPGGGYARFEALFLRDGYVQSRALWSTDGRPLPEAGAAEALIRALQTNPPPLSAAPLNQITTPDGLGLAVSP